MIRMSLERILRLLEDLGLSKDEAEVYVYLAKKGPQTIKALTENLKKNNNEIVRTLKGLEEKQITTRKTRRSTFFLAIPFEKLLTDYAKIRFNQAKRIEKTRLSFMADWKETIKEKDQFRLNNS